MGADEVWSTYGIDGTGVVVGVIDTGLCLSHPDIQAQVWTNPCEIPANGVDDDLNGFVDDLHGWNFESNNPNVTDFHGHGSHVSGTVAGDGTQGQQSGMAPGAQIMVLKFWNSFSGEVSVWQSMQYGLANGADILTASLGWHHGFNPDRATWRMVCENTIAGGVIVVYAAHNFYCGNPPDDVATPGDVPDVITVGATNCNDVKADFSSCGPVTWQNVPPYNDWPYPPGLTKPTIAAPGVNTLSHDLCNGYEQLSGTSMATPHVAGALALILQADPALDQFSATTILRATAVDLGIPGEDNEFGSGRVDAFAAVQAALANGNFCAPKTNSCGGVPHIAASGTPSASASSGYVVTGSSARGGDQFGLLAYTDAGLALPPPPFGGGLLCLQAPIQRGPVVLSGGTEGQCDGMYQIDWNAFASGALGGSPAPFLSVPGTEVTCQWWGRDTVEHGIYLTEALQYTVCF
jgi:serine protease AprX